MDKNLDVRIYNGTEKEREEAKKLGMTSGKYHEDHLTASPIQKQKGNKEQEEDPGEVGQKAAEPAVTAPPGQLNKPVTNSSNNTNGNADHLNKNDSKDTKVPPGQLKKNSQESVNLNFGQLKKQDEDSINKTLGQKKKKTESPKKQNKNSYHKPQSNHKEKH